MNKQEYVFQVDSDTVQEVYKYKDNYLVEYDESASDRDTCAVYFSSNDIYFPNTEEVFGKRIKEKNFFEWYKCRISNTYKHIFVRDVFKQWYLAGVNAKTNNIDALAAWLKNETEGCSRIEMIGSSAGAYAAILFGSILGASRVMAFNPQFVLSTLLDRSSESVNPLVFRMRDGKYRMYYDIRPYINKLVPIYYFYSNRSKWDMEQHALLGKVDSVCEIAFDSAHHGIPFLKVALPVVINASDNALRNYSQKVHNPVLFTLGRVGIRKTVKGFISQVYQAYKKRR